MKTSTKIRNLPNLVVTILLLSFSFNGSVFANEEESNGNELFKLFKEYITQIKAKEIKGAELESAKAFIEVASLVIGRNKNYGNNPSETIRLVQEAADMNIGCAQYALSTFYGGVKLKNPNTDEEVDYFKKNKEEELKWLKKAAHSECGQAHRALGIKYREGLIVTANYKESAYWFKEAALRGYADAMLITSINYVTGNGFKKDKVLSLAWITLCLKHVENDPELLAEAKKLKSELEEELKKHSVAKAQNESAKIDKKIFQHMKQISKSGARK